MLFGLVVGGVVAEFDQRAPADVRAVARTDALAALLPLAPHDLRLDRIHP